MKKYYNKLYTVYGTHSAVANELGITPRHYRAIRNGHLKAHPSTEKLVKCLYASVIAKESFKKK